MKKQPRQLITLKNISDQELLNIVNRGVEYANGTVELGKQLEKKVIGIYFSKTSTRTRTSFSSAALRLGANIIAYGPDDLQLNTGESMEDTLQVLSQMLDGLVVRTPIDSAILSNFTNYGDMSIINAMTLDEHPTQALADLTTIKLHFGAIDGINLVYLGEGNNTAAALAIAFSKFSNVKIHFFTPENYGLDKELLEYAQIEAEKRNSQIYESHDLTLLPSYTDIIYTTRWQTTGTTKKDIHWKKAFKPFMVTEKLLNKYPNAIFMHDLPAHREEEVETSVIDGHKSIVFEQAKNKFNSAKAVLEWCLK